MKNVIFVFSDTHGIYKKGDEVEMNPTTAKAMAAHKIGSIKTSKTESKPVEEEKTESKASGITTKSGTVESKNKK